MATTVFGLKGDLSLETASFESGAQRARRAMQTSLQGINQEVSKSRVALESLTAGLKGLAAGAAAGIGVAGIQQFGAAIIKAGDAAQQLRAKLDFSFGQGGFEQAKRSAQELGVSTATVANTLDRLANALKDVGATQAQIVNITEVLTQMGRVSGRTGAEVEAALTQFSQGLSKGTLDGDELKSVLETMPPIVRLLADELGVSAGELRDLGAEGKITSEVIVRAFENGGDAIRQQFESLPESLDQATARMGNAAESLFATLDSKLAASGFYKFFIGGLEEAFSSIDARLNLIDPTPRVQAFERLRDVLAEIERNTVPEGTPQTPGQIAYLDELERQAAEARAEVDRLGASLEKAANSNNNTLRLQAERGSLTASTGSSASPLSLYPARTAEDEKIRNDFLRDARRTAEEVAKAARDADEKRVASAKRASDELRRLEEDRADYNAENIRDELAAFEKAQEDKKKATEDFNRFLLGIERDIADQKNREAERVAQQQADILAQPYKDLAGQISGIVADGINDALTDPENFDFGDIADSFGNAMAGAISGSIAIALTQQLNEAAVSFAQKLAANLSGTGGGQPLVGSTTDAAFAGAAGGYVVGSVYGQVTGRQGTYSGVGGSIGGALGSGIGFAVGGPAGALVGGAVGSLAGSALGGLFGSENNLGNDRSAQTFNSRRGIIYSDRSFSPENRNITAGIANEVQTLIDLFGDLGGSVATFQLRLEAGNKSGITVNGRRYDTAADAIAGAIETLIGNTTNLTASQQTVLQNTSGTSAQQVAADLAFADTFDQLTFTGNEVDLVLQDLARTFTAAGRQAAELGLNVDALAQAHQRAAEEVVAEFQARQQAASLQIETLARTSGGTADLQLAQLEISMQNLAREAVELGISLDRVTAAHQAQAAAIIFQIDQQQRNIYAQLAVARGDDSLNTQLFILETQFRDLAAAAAAAGIPLQQVYDAHAQAAANLEAEVRARQQAEADAERARREAEAEERRQRQQQATNLRNQLNQLAGGNTLGAALDALKAQFADFRAQAEELGVPLALVNRAYRAQAEALREQFALQAQQLRVQLRGVIEGNTLSVQLAEIALQFAELRNRAEELGVPLKLVAEAEAAAVKAARERVAAEKAAFEVQLRRIGGERGLAVEMAALALEMEEAKKRARELGIPIKDVTDAYKAAADALREEQREKANSLRLQLRQIAGEKSVSLELALLDERFADLREQAEELGVPLDLVTKAHRAAADAIIEAQKELIKSTEEQRSSIERQLRDQVRGVQGIFDGLIDPLRDAIANDNRLSPLAQINQAQARFRETAALARSGDVEAIRNLAGDAGNLRDLASRFLGSGEQGSRIAREIDAALRATVGTLEQQRTETLASLPQVQRETVAELIRENKKDTAAIVEALDKVTKELARLKKAA